MTTDREKRRRLELWKRHKYFGELWDSQRGSLTVGQRDEIGRAYLRHYIGVDDAVILNFENWSKDKGPLEARMAAAETVGMRQAGVVPRKEDYRSFWEVVNGITPGAYKPDDLAWLAENTNIEVIVRFTNAVEPDPLEAQQSELSLITSISANALCYR